MTKVDELTIRKELRKDGIVVDIPHNYYELFANPFFLSVGKTILKKSPNRQLFNRSQLLSELFIELYAGMERKEGRGGHQLLSFSEALSVLGKIAYESFDKASYSMLEFDQLITENVTSDKANIITSFVCSGLFLVSNRVTFVHKLLIEFCAAYHLVNKYKVDDNTSLFEEYISNDNWKEVLIFAAGLYNDIALQDSFLDLVMQRNLPLYVECVNSKSDLLLESSETSSPELAKRILSQIHRTYSYIIPHYFSPIASRFDPQKTDAFLPASGKKVGIFGYLSQDGNLLNYFFDVISKDEKEIVCVAEKDYPQYLTNLEKRSVYERRNISFHGVSLKLSGLQGDSGRKLALDLIKKRVKEIIENKELIESPYLLCERLEGYKKRIKELREITELSEMKSMVDAKIERVRKTTPTVAGITCNGIELFHLQRLITTLYEQGINYNNCLLPNEDVTPDEAGSYWIWDYYSEEQKVKRLSFFFYFHELSYVFMVERNFPRLCTSFSRYKDVPYQTVVIINHKRNEKADGILSDTIIEYYYTAAEGEEIPMPNIIEFEDWSPIHNLKETIADIQNSYLRQGKVAHSYSIAQTGFSSTLTSRRTGAANPLSDFVYGSIQKDLETILGQF